ncbi:hypothetical protein BJ508DRAFT_414367 [Ascobolus immersus RN42]|uniref:Uncharacterized protein n=1 Tax=Ascobolus immersus RN42 TaxID=1160509 RepID=A0A3N4IKG2_ASCIM|nr:hypothetical protein BJ508DRAFT_414367 [Ascobolus immersus RN42]
MATGPVALQPIALKDAATDSPTFRAIVNYYAEQVDHVDRWLDGFVKTASRISIEMSGFEDALKQTLIKLIPTNVNETVVDHDFTLLAIQTFAEGASEFWSTIFHNARRFDALIVEPIVNLQKEELRIFKEAKRAVDTTQAKYDSSLARFLAQSKTKEPSALREDAFQVYEARKAYLKSALDFSVAASTLRAVLDKTLTTALTNQWAEHISARTTTSTVLGQHRRNMERVKAWSEDIAAHEKYFKQTLLNARREIEESSKKEFMPARELDEYSAVTVPYLVGKGLDKNSKEDQSIVKEKQGWLYFRTVTGKPARTVWTRRWFFLRDGIFGSLAGGVRSGSIEESEKIGVLLCNVKPAFQEDRRFCFEVKTKDNAIMLQAETQQDLTSWLDVFENAKRAALDSSSSSSSQAFAIIPSSTATSTITMQHHDLLSIAHNHTESVGLGFDKQQPLSPGGPNSLRPSVDERRVAQRSSGPTTSGLSALVTASTGTFVQTPANIGPGHALAHAATFHVGSGAPPMSPTKSTTLAPLTLANTVSPKALAKAAAVTATRSPLDVYGSRPTIERSTPSGHRKTLSLDTGSQAMEDGFDDEFDSGLPEDYPEVLRTQDSHFRTLFPEAPEKLPLLLVVRASWITSTKQSYPGRCYITAKTIYFFSHYFGMEFKTSLNLNNIYEVSGVYGKDFDQVYLDLEPESPVEGQIDRIGLRVFIETGRVVQRRLDLLVRNARGPRESAIGSKELLQKLETFAEEKEEGRRESLVSTMESPILDPKHTTSRINRPSHGRGRDVMLTLPSQPVIYTPPGVNHLSVEKIFELSAKALFHLIFGDRSSVFQTLYLERRAHDIVQGQWVPVPEETDGKFRRDFKYQIEYRNAFKQRKQASVVDHQTVDRMDEHLCYVVSDKKTPWHLPHHNKFMLITKVVITHVSKSRSKLAIYTTVDWSGIPSLARGMIEKQALEDLESDALDLADVVADTARQLGPNSRTKKAVDMFGDIGKEEPHVRVDGTIIRTQRTPIMHRQLSHMVWDNVLSFIESALTSLIVFIVAVGKKGFEIVTAQRVLILLLIGSTLFNGWLSTRSVSTYWHERKASKIISRLGVDVNPLMSKAIYLKDIEDMLSTGDSLARTSSKECYSKFIGNTEAVSNPNGRWEFAGRDFGSSATKRMAQALKRKRQNLAVYRNNLLVSLRLINRYEQDVVRAQWESWLVEENRKCAVVKNNFGRLLEKKAAQSSQQSSAATPFSSGQRGEQKPLGNFENKTNEELRAKVAETLGDYCRSCSEELESLNSNFS